MFLWYNFQNTSHIPQSVIKQYKHFTPIKHFFFCGENNLRKVISNQRMLCAISNRKDRE